MSVGNGRQPNTRVQLQPRDYDLLRGLFECRLMTLGHAAAMFFDGRLPAATKRVQCLKSGGYLLDRRQRVGEPSVLFLSLKAFDALRASGRLDGFPRLTAEQFNKRSRVEASTLNHELGVIDVKVAITQAIVASAGRHRVAEFTTWPALSQFNVTHPEQHHRVTVRPDGYLHLIEKKDVEDERDHRFFLELDRSTEAQRVLTDKSLCYRAYYASGGFAERRGEPASAFRQHPFRVLVVLRTAERRNNTAERLMNCFPPLKAQAWLTTLPEVLADPLGKIWVCPQDYSTATNGTAYAPERWRNRPLYVRRSERERLVEERIVKRTLFDGAS